MKGHIRQRNKNLVVFVDIGKDPATGKRKRHWETMPAGSSKRDAQRRLREILTSVETGVYIKPSHLTLADWLQQWLNGHVATDCAPRTQAGYEEIIRLHIVPAIGQIPLAQLEPQQIETFCDAKAREGKIRTARHCYALLRTTLGHAVKMGAVARNAALACDPPRLERKTMTTLAASDFPRFFEAISESPYRMVFVTLLASGMRRGEVLALKWKNLDLSRPEMGYARVVESGYKVHGHWETKEPKTTRSRRPAALPGALVALLLEHKRSQAELFGEQLTEEGYVFCTHEGKPLDPCTVSRAFGRVLQKAGLPHMRLHDLRHTYATLLLKGGQHPSVVAAQLGHSTVMTTLDVYSHVLPGLQEAAARSMESFLPKQLPAGNQERNGCSLVAVDA